MDKMRKMVIWIGVYFLIFWIGFRVGEAYFRMKDRLDRQKEKVMIPAPPAVHAPPHFYIIERRDYGSYSHVAFEEVGADDPRIKFLFNRNLRPFLKLRDLKIYKSDGERIY